MKLCRYVTEIREYMMKIRVLIITRSKDHFYFKDFDLQDHLSDELHQRNYDYTEMSFKLKFSRIIFIANVYFEVFQSQMF